MGVSLAMITILALGAIGIFLGLKLLENYRPGRNKIQKDLVKIKAEMKPYVSDLVPVNREELGQLSLNQIKKSTKKGITQTHRGVFTTVYHEPLIAWTYRKYVGSKENALIYARTQNQEFTYRIKKKGVEIMADDLILGMMDDKGVLHPRKGKKALAMVNRSSQELGLPVIINNREVGSLSNSQMVSKSNPRAFQYIAEMTEEDEKIFLALSIYEMIKNSI